MVTLQFHRILYQSVHVLICICAVNIVIIIINLHGFISLAGGSQNRKQVQYVATWNIKNIVYSIILYSYDNVYMVIESFISNRKILPPSLSGSPPRFLSLCFLLIHHLHQPVVSHLFQFCLPLPRLLLYHLNHCFLPKCLPHLLIKFLTLSILIKPCTLLKHIISNACSLLTCLFCSVHVSHPYRSVGTTIYH